jgi:hypothetical protein
MPAQPKSVIPPATFLNAIRNIGKGLYNKTALMAGYRGANPTNTTRIGSRIGTNANSTFASIQRVGMNWTAEDVAKNSPIAAAYLNTRRIYCKPKMFVPDTGDHVLDQELKDYLKMVWRNGGINCSMFQAFERTSNIELPVRGDSGLIWYRDETQLRLMEWSADQCGEVYQFTNPSYMADGSFYFAGRYFASNGQCSGYKIYERINSWYGKPQHYGASDVIYFQDNMFRGMRGITKFANALQHMEKGENLFQIGMDAALRQSKTAMIVYNEQGAPDELTYESQSRGQWGDVYANERIPGGPLVEYRYTGEKADFMSPDSPGPELIDGCEFSDERVALALGFTYAFLVNCSKLGGAPSRLDTNRSGKEIERIIEDVLTPPLEIISYITIMDAVDRGIFPPLPTITRGHWPFVNLPTADAFKDSMDDIKSVRAGQDSDTRVVARTGTTYPQIMRDRENEAFLKYKALNNVNTRLKSAGIPFVATIADIAQVSDNPQQAAAAEAIDTGKPAAGGNGDSPNGNGNGNATSNRVAKFAHALLEFDESKHPRGQPDNAGEFGSGGGGAQVKKQDDPSDNHPYLDAKTKYDAIKDKISSQNWEGKTDELYKLYDKRDDLYDEMRKHEKDYMQKSTPHYHELRDTLLTGDTLNNTGADISRHIVYQGETSPPEIESISGLDAGDSSRISDSVYPTVELKLSNGKTLFKQIRISNHGQVSSNAPRSYDIDIRAAKVPRTTKQFKSIEPEVIKELQPFADNIWQEQKKVIEAEREKK